jgi:hypothetical protein
MRLVAIAVLLALGFIGNMQWAAAQVLWQPAEIRRAGMTRQIAKPQATVPLPKPRPLDAGPRTSSGAAAKADAEAAAELLAPSACFAALTAGLAEAQQLPPIAGENGCEAPDVVQLDAVILSDRRRVAVSPPAVLRCTMATAVANWVRGDLFTAVAAQGGLLNAIDNFDSFECRGRNRVVGAKTSEHGRANALDIRAVLLNGGRRLELTNPEVAREFREALRVSVCASFTTVLGPGSDGYHEDHVHIDLAERRNGYRICQWDVRDPTVPLPRDRPADAPLANNGTGTNATGSAKE